MKQIELSIVCPAYNEADNLSELIKQVIDSLDRKINYEIIIVDDGSTDSSLSVVKKIAKKNTRVKCLSLSRNFGHQRALLAGLYEACGQVIITMDSDLQHPPKYLNKMFDSILEGSDMVVMQKKNIKNESLFRATCRSVWYFFMSRFSGVRVIPNASDFRAYKRWIVDYVKDSHDSDPIIRILSVEIARDIKIIPFQPADRFAGISKYTLKKLIRFAWDGIIQYSTMPVKLFFLMGLILILISSVYTVYAVIERLINPNSASGGFTSIFLFMTLSNSMIITFLGFLGMKLIRLESEVKKRPIFVIKERVNI